MQTLYIIRHGKTEWNDKGMVQGLTDISLNEEGINEAKKISKTIDLDNIDLCLCSPLKRAKETAEILVNNKKEIIYDNKLVERGFGNYEGKKIEFELIIRQWDYNLNDGEDNIESIKDCLDRAKTFLEEIKGKYPNKRILIVSHGSFIKALHYNIVGYDKSTDFLSFRPDNTTLYQYEI